MQPPAQYPQALTLADGSSLTLLEPVRELPGRRLVCRASWQGQTVYAKLFFGSKAERDACRDAAGARALLHACIQTPALLYEGGVDGDESRALVYRAVNDGRNAEAELYALSNDADGRRALAERLVATVAAHHQAGLVQQDMYLKNFLVAQAQVLTLDGDGIRCYPAPLGRPQSLQNLAVLLSKFDVVDDVRIPRLFADYAHSRGWPVRPADVRRLMSVARHHRRRVARGYAEHKVFRNCSDVEVARSLRHFQALVRCQDTGELRAMLADPETWFALPEVSYLKRGNTSTVVSLQLDGRGVVVKRYNIKSFWHGVGRAWRASRAAVSWSNAHRLMMYGVDTAKPLALLERRWGWVRRQAYFVTEQVDAPDAAQFFAESNITEAQKRRAALQIARLLHKLGSLQIVHGDMKATNIKILPDGQPLLLDLDALHEVRWSWLARRGQVRDLRRLLQNWRGLSATRDMLQDALRLVYQDAELLRQAGVSIQNSEEK